MWDYIIVGAGSAGCVLANRLTADGKHKVLLLEAGGSDRNPLLRIPPLGAFLSVRNPKRDWNYRTLPDPSRNNRTELWPRGKILGGSSSINGMIYVRGDRDDYNHWAQLGNMGWAFDDVLPHFKAVESYEFEQNDYGQDGPLNVKQIKGAHPLSHAFVDACVESGIPRNVHYNGPDQEGASILHVTQTKRIRHSSAQAFLQPARGRKNLTIETSALATKILFEGSRAVGLEYQQGETKHVAQASREIILAGGSINSPQLMMLSGLGPAEQLRSHNIEVVSDLAGVGQNLHEHPCIPLQVEVSISTPNVELNPWAAVKYASQYMFKGAGPLTSVVFQALAFAKTETHMSHPDVQIHFGAMGYGADGDKIILTDRPAITFQANVNRSRSRGELTLASNSPFDPPNIQPNMLADDYDLKTLIAAGKLCQKLCETDALKPYCVKKVYPDENIQTDEAWEAYVRAVCGPTFHPVGTCKMGVDDDAVVTPDLKVKGIEGLRVADGSVMPHVVSGNTNAACLMIGEKGAGMILADARG